MKDVEAGHAEERQVDQPILTPPTVLGALFRHRVLAVLLIVVGALLGVAYTLVKPPTVTSTAIIILHNPQVGQGNDSLTATRYVGDQAILMSSDLVLEHVRTTLASASPPLLASTRALRKNLHVATASSSNTLSVSYSATAPALAKRVVDAVVLTYQSQATSSGLSIVDAQLAKVDGEVLRLDKVIQEGPSPSEVETARAARALALEQRVQLLLRESAPAGIDQLVPGTLPPPPNVVLGRVQPVSLGIIVGVLAAAFATYLVSGRVRRFVHESEPSAVLNLPELATVTVPSRLRRPGDSRPPLSLNLDLLTQYVIHVHPDARVAAIVSAGHDDPRRAAVQGLARSMASRGKRVVVLQEQAPADLAGSLLGDVAPGGLVAQRLQLGDAAVDVVSCDPLRAGHVLHEVLSQTNRGKAYDFCIVDVPRMAMGFSADLLTAANINVLVVSQNDDVRQLERLAERLSLVSAPVVGYVYIRGAERLRRGRNDDALSSEGSTWHLLTPAAVYGGVARATRVGQADGASGRS